jgi:hypothetical protein
MKTIIITESQLQIIVENEKVKKYKHSLEKKSKRIADKDISKHFKKSGDVWSTDVTPSEKWPRHTLPYDTKFNFDEINENYNPEKLYAKAFIDERKNKAPKYLKKYFAGLEEIKKDGKTFVKIPQIIYQYLNDKF